MFDIFVTFIPNKFTLLNTETMLTALVLYLQVSCDLVGGDLALVSLFRADSARLRGMVNICWDSLDSGITTDTIH